MSVKRRLSTFIVIALYFLRCLNTVGCSPWKAWFANPNGLLLTSRRSLLQCGFDVVQQTVEFPDDWHSRTTWAQVLVDPVLGVSSDSHVTCASDQRFVTWRHGHGTWQLPASRNWPYCLLPCTLWHCSQGTLSPDCCRHHLGSFRLITYWLID